MATKSKTSKAGGSGKTSSDDINQRDSSQAGKSSSNKSGRASRSGDDAQFEGQGGLTSTDSDVAGVGSTFDQSDANKIDSVGDASGSDDSSERSGRSSSSKSDRRASENSRDNAEDRDDELER